MATNTKTKIEAKIKDQEFIEIDDPIEFITFLQNKNLNKEDDKKTIPLDISGSKVYISIEYKELVEEYQSSKLIIINEETQQYFHLGFKYLKNCFLIEKNTQKVDRYDYRLPNFFKISCVEFGSKTELKSKTNSKTISKSDLENKTYHLGDVLKIGDKKFKIRKIVNLNKRYDYGDIHPDCFYINFNGQDIINPIYEINNIIFEFKRPMFINYLSAEDRYSVIIPQICILDII